MKKMWPRHSVKSVTGILLLVCLCLLAVGCHSSDNNSVDQSTTIQGLWQFCDEIDCTTFPGVVDGFFSQNGDVCQVNFRIVGTDITAKSMQVVRGGGNLSGAYYLCYTWEDENEKDVNIYAYIGGQASGWELKWNNTLTTLDGRKIDFGEVPQQVPERFYGWMVENAEPVSGEE